MNDFKYLKLLAKDYPTIKAVSAEIINLNAILCLPKGTEYFFSDLHGEYEAFLRLLRNASGSIYEKIELLFSEELSKEQTDYLSDLIYDCKEVMKNIKADGEWYKDIISKLVLICREVGSKYTRSKVRKNMPAEYAYIIDELLHTPDADNKKVYYGEIINSIIETGAADGFIEELCSLIQRLSIDSLHIIGDIFDRGPRPDIIIDELMKFHDVDIEWGNHDISWMGAACGNKALVANVVRNGISYNTFDVLEDGYGINLRALSVFAAEIYGNDPCASFIPRRFDENKYDSVDIYLAAKMHKAISIIQFKLEGQLLERRPEYGMNDRNVLKNINYADGTININGKIFKLSDTSFPTIDTQNPLNLTKEEDNLINILGASFKHSAALSRHIKYLYANGSAYKCVNSNLLFHGCIPMTADGGFGGLKLDGQLYKGKELMDNINTQVRNAYFLQESGEKQEYASDFMWYLWCGSKSPMFGKSKLALFESHFIEDKAARKEEYNPYFKLNASEEICDKILNEFGLNPETSHIINGHVPVKRKDGESPIKAGGKLYVIDGGISKAYQLKTGIAGYTLIYNSRNLSLAEHKRVSDAGRCVPELLTVGKENGRISVADTDIGKKIKESIADLKRLLEAYKDGKI